MQASAARKPFHIAEVGSNFGGDLQQAKSYIEQAAQAGASAIKFQTLTKETLLAQKTIIDGALVENPRWSLFGNAGLPEEWHQELRDYAHASGIQFASTAFYLEAVDVMEACGVDFYKIASGDITFRPLLERVGATGKRVILSTGASSLKEVEQALNTLLSAGAGKVDLLHCVVSYPPHWEDMNLRAIATLKSEFGVDVGLSDHGPGALAPVMAVALGATIFEKHVTHDRSAKGPDHPFAMTFPEYAEMVQQTKHATAALGTGVKVGTEDELKRKHWFRRGTYDRHTGLPAKEGDLVWLRPEWKP
jgi:N,N'-diacetyllegionaminate synthase